MTPSGYIAVYHRLQEEALASSLFVQPGRRGYFCGEQIEREIKGITGESLGVQQFIIAENIGSGFAGQVYRADRPLNPRCPRSSVSPFQHRPVALKVLRPKNRWKEAFRDALFRLSYQTPYAPRLREAAVRAGLLWQELLQMAATAHFQVESVVARPWGYYWDDAIGSYVEIHEWIEGREARYEADERMLSKKGNPPNHEMNRKRKFMGELAALCRQIGALGLARQYEWWTFVSQANVLTRIQPAERESEFVAVDCRPGLAVPFFLPLSPAHLRIILRGLPRGVFVHFDEVDFARLDRFIAAHSEELGGVQALLRQLKADDAGYRAALPDLWHRRARIFRNGAFHRSIREAIIQDWQKLNRISEKEANRLRAAPRRFLFPLLLSCLPLALSLWGNERYRSHWGEALKNPAYRRTILAALKARDLLTWQDQQRITPAEMQALAASAPRYWLEKLTLAWLPRGVHRFCTDGAARRQLLDALLIRPLRLCFDRTYRAEWLVDILEQESQQGIITPERAQFLKEQCREPHMQGYLRDFGLTLALEVVAKVIYLLLAVYGVSTANFWPLGIAALGPLSPSGVLRAAYVLMQLLVGLPRILKARDKKLFLTRLLGLCIAPWRYIGNLFALLEMFTDYPDISLLLGDFYVTKLVNTIPILGGRGKLLEYTAFNLLYNVPLSVRYVLLNSCHRNT